MLMGAGDRLSEFELRQLPTPAGTDTHQPIPHSVLLDTVIESLSDRHITVDSAEHLVTHENMRYFGLLHVHNGAPGDPSYARVLGVRNSHDKMFPAGVCFGNQVMVCSNLSFAGEIIIKRKHTARILTHLPHLVNGLTDQLRAAWHDEDQRIISYRSADITDVDAHDLTIGALDSKVICSTKLPKVLQHWREPQHDEFSDRTVWSWFNAVTETLKGSNPMQLAGRTTALHGVCDRFLGRNLHLLEA